MKKTDDSNNTTDKAKNYLKIVFAWLFTIESRNGSDRMHLTMVWGTYITWLILVLGSLLLFYSLGVENIMNLIVQLKK